MARRADDLYGRGPERKSPMQGETESSASSFSWRQPWTRIVTMVVVCACALVVTAHRLHTPAPNGVRHVVVQVKQGDGYMVPSQCASLTDRDNKDSVRRKYGVPKDWDTQKADTDGSWWYPIRGKASLWCGISFNAYDGVERVSLDLYDSVGGDRVASLS